MNKPLRKVPPLSAEDEALYKAIGENPNFTIEGAMKAFGLDKEMKKPLAPAQVLDIMVSLGWNPMEFDMREVMRFVKAIEEK